MISTSAMAPNSPSMKGWIFAKQKDGVAKTFQQLQNSNKTKKRPSEESLSVKIYEELQRLHINHKTIFHIAFQHSFIRFIDVLHFN